MTQQRAKDLMDLYRHQNGVCLRFGAKQPNIQPESPQERAAVLAVWKTMPGSWSYNSVLVAIAQGRIRLDICEVQP